MNKSIILGVVALVVSIVAVLTPGMPGQNGQDGIGAVSGPDISSPYISINGVRTFYERAIPRNATTTICALRSPAATSTLISGAINITNASTTARMFEIGKGTTAFATTTTLTGQMNLAAGAKATYHVNDVEGGSADEAMVFAPSTFMVVSMLHSGSTAATNAAVTGACQATFEVI